MSSEVTPQLILHPAESNTCESNTTQGTPPAEGITARVVSGEIQDFVRSHERRRRQLPRCLSGLDSWFRGRVLSHDLRARRPVPRLAH